MYICNCMALEEGLLSAYIIILIIQGLATVSTSHILASYLASYIN